MTNTNKYIAPQIEKRLAELANGKPRYLPSFMLDALINTNPEGLHVSARKDVISILGRHLITPKETLDEKVWVFLRKISQEDNPILREEARSWIENFDVQLKEYDEVSKNPLIKLFSKLSPAYGPSNASLSREYQALIPNVELELFMSRCLTSCILSIQKSNTTYKDFLI